GRCSAIAQAVSGEAWCGVASNSMPVLAFANSNAGNASECSDFSASDAAPQASVYAMATAIEH
ncbi:hypothetical protein, partial [Xanthomonas axonopodis]|uniref:hypothetical protein n=1 Tax=Xanthomonas axonopodis TaxID=53413 RepID=UPI00117C6C8B